MNTEHVTATIEAFCKHCGKEDSVISIAAVDATDVLRAFLIRHRRCEKPMEPSKQVQLFDEQLKREIEAQEIAADGGNGSVCSVHEYEPIDGATESPAPEIDPPPPVDDYAKFYAMYPFAQDTPQLRQLLGTVLTLAQIGHLNAQPLPSPDTAAFQYIAAWVRIECAHVDSEARGIAGSIPGLTIPARLPMPNALKKLLNPPKPKRGARPLANPKPKKRRSGSTQHTD